MLAAVPALAVVLASGCTDRDGAQGRDTVRTTAEPTVVETTSAAALASAPPEPAGETRRGVLLAPAQSSTAPLWVRLEDGTIDDSDVVVVVRLSRRALVCSSTGEMRELATVERPAAVRLTWQPQANVAMGDQWPPHIAASRLAVEGC